MPPQMYPLSEDDPMFRDHLGYFNRNWRHPNKTPVVRKVFVASQHELAASHRGRRFHRYGGRSVDRSMVLYHGTTRACNAGEERGGRRMQWCNMPHCNFCGIMRNSFKVRKSVPGMFGRGIYTTQVSSKADHYANSLDPGSRLRAMIVCEVISNRPQRMFSACPNRTAPDHGYDSVQAAVLRDGGQVMYPETVVYRDDAIIPAAVIMYERV